MKRLLSGILSILMLLTLATVALAENPASVMVSSETIAFEDGSYAVVSVYDDTNPYVRSGHKDGHKTYTFVSGGQTIADFTIYGTFTFDGSTATASNPSNDYNIYDSSWSCTKHTSSASGASIKGSYAFLKNTGTKKSGSLTLTCSPSGKLS